MFFYFCYASSQITGTKVQFIHKSGSLFNIEAALIEQSENVVIRDAFIDVLTKGNLNIKLWTEFSVFNPDNYIFKMYKKVKFVIHDLRVIAEQMVFNGNNYDAEAFGSVRAYYKNWRFNTTFLRYNHNMQTIEYPKGGIVTITDI